MWLVLSNHVIKNDVNVNNGITSYQIEWLVLSNHVIKINADVVNGITSFNRVISAP